MKKPAMIILIGERDISKRGHAGIEASLDLYRRDFDPTLQFRWVPTRSISARAIDDVLGGATGMWCTPGSPYEHTDGALQAIRYARERGRAFLGTCGGFQHALMEYSRAVLGGNSAHQEMERDAPDPLIAKLACSLVEARARVIAPPGGWYADVVGAAESTEEFHCSYGLSPSFQPVFSGSALEFVAHDEAGQVRAFRLSGHPFFVGTLFQPERRALSGSLHPIVYAFLKHA